MFVLVDDAAKALVSSYVQAVRVPKISSMADDLHVLQNN
jgi:hypothetical protein